MRVSLTVNANQDDLVGETLLEIVGADRGVFVCLLHLYMVLMYQYKLVSELYFVTDLASVGIFLIILGRMVLFESKHKLLRFCFT